MYLITIHIQIKISNEVFTAFHVKDKKMEQIFIIKISLNQKNCLNRKDMY